MPRSLKKAALLFLLSACFPGSLSAQTPKIDPKAPVLTTASGIARLPNTSLLQPAVDLRSATITFIDPNGTTFIRDETGATFFRSNRSNTYQPGQTVAIRGVRFPGLYIGGIAPSKVDVLSAGPPPQPRTLTLRDLETGHHHYEFVEVAGVGRSFELTGETTGKLRLNVEGGILEVQFDQAPEDGPSLVDAEVRIRGLAAGAINDHRQLVYPYLRAIDGSAVTVIQPPPADPFATKDTPLSSLFDFARTGSASHRVKISGTALGPLIHGSVFIRQDNRSVRVIMATPLPGLRAGDQVEALGFPEMGGFSAMLADAALRVTSHGSEPPSAIKPDLKQINSGALDADLVTIEGTVIQHLENDNTLIVRTPTETLRVLSHGWKLPPVATGSEARFTGIWLVKEVRSTSRSYRAAPASHELWLRSAEDVTLLSAPSWWNSTKLSVMLGIVAGAGLLVLIWAALLQRQVARQVKIIEVKAQREAMIEERQRIAREFHDTLEQELAGLSLRLDAAVPRVSDEKAKGLLDQLRKLLFRLQTETRDFVWDLRDESQHSEPLETSLDILIDHLQTTTVIPLEYSPMPDLPPVPALAQHHLLRIAREAVNNAIKYSSAKRVRISLSHAPGTIHLRVEDDGAGFDVSGKSNSSGHFGLQGMKERVRKLGAELDIRSKPGEGTCIEVVLAIPSAA
ncbi:MAG: sensor histidine kinase [Akkermansiaceae bacterium]|nr:sensor histidine kinase [Akkermansiaceae bacterium]